jgi:hypothetical protein
MPKSVLVSDLNRAACFCLCIDVGRPHNGATPEHENRHAQKKGMSVKPEVEAAVVSIRENPNDHTARVNLRWEGKHQISDFALNKLGTVLNSEDETDQHSGWAIVESPVKAAVGKTIPLLKEAK